MIQKHLIWRKIHQLDTILEDFKPTEFFVKYAEPTVIGHDKDGDIVRYSATGKLNPTDILKCMTWSWYRKHFYWTAENSMALLEKENLKTGRHAFQIVCIVDFDKLTFKNATCKAGLQTFMEIIINLQNYYPERLKSAYIINAPNYAVLSYSVIQSLMSSTTRRKIQMFGSTGWKEKLLKIIDADVLPAFLGGNRTDPDGNPLCKTFVNHDGQIPESHFLSDEGRHLTGATGVKKIIVPPKGKEEVGVEVEDVGHLIRWEFSVKSKDIRFGILLEAPEHQTIEVIPMERYSTSEGKEIDFMKCRVTGKYIIVFDNSYSWMSAKEIHYRISVVKPTP